MEGSSAELKRDISLASKIYEKAWKHASNDYQKCIAAHYMARNRKDSDEEFYWNETALKHANLVTDNSVQSFYPSLYLNMGHSYELKGNSVEAEKFYKLAKALGFDHLL
jgi:hypothetical protein